MTSGHVICAYRGVGGRACAVGCLVEDKDYDPKMEGFGPDYIVSTFKQLHGQWWTKELLLLENLQQLHDAVDPDEWPIALRAIAKSFNLKVPKCLK